MDKKLYELHELLDGTLKVGQIARSVDLDELNFDLWFNPKTLLLEYKDYKDYPEQSIEITAEGDEDCTGAGLFRILP